MAAKGKRVAIVMGSVADEPVMKKASDMLKEFGVDYEKQILSAHRMPNKTREFAKSIKENGIEYSKIYDKGFTQTGCIFCAFGVQFEREPNRYQKLKELYPEKYEYVINKLGFGEVLDFIGVAY